jgi:DNA-binding transcriptional ArsR family regulator
MSANLVDIDDPRLVKALAHPIRMQILNILDERTSTPKELAALLGLPLENVSYHVRTLKDFGFIKLEKTRQVRGAVEHHYKIAARPRVGAKLWEQTPRVVQEALLDSTLGVIVEAIGRSASEGGFDHTYSSAARHSVVVDEEGRKKIYDVLARAADEVEAIAKASQKNVKDGEGQRLSAAFLLFDTPTYVPPEEAAKQRDAKGRRRTQGSTA